MSCRLLFILYMQVATSIIEGYIILGGNEFLNMHASDVARLLDLVVENANDKGLLSILPAIDILIQVNDVKFAAKEFLLIPGHIFSLKG
jgi:hypothetical protein